MYTSPKGFLTVSHNITLSYGLVFDDNEHWASGFLFNVCIHSDWWTVNVTRIRKNGEVVDLTVDVLGAAHIVRSERELNALLSEGKRVIDEKFSDQLHT